MANEFFNSNNKTPYVKFETADGSISLGKNTLLNGKNDFSDGIFLSDVKVEVASDHVLITVTIDVTYKTWTNLTFSDILEKLVEEPYTTSEQRIDGGAPKSTDGVWILQFGWRGNNFEETYTPEIKCVTIENSVSVLPELRGSISITKKLIMLPLIYLDQTYISRLENVRSYITEQTNLAKNTKQAKIIPKKIFELLVKDLRSIYGSSAPGLPTLDSFLFAATNFFNDKVTAETVYTQWVTQPLANLSSLNQITVDEDKDLISTSSWLSSWLRENDMEIIPAPFRVFSDHGDLGFIIKVANVETDQSVVSSYEVRADKDTRNNNFYRYQWKPMLDILKRDSIVENATFEFVAGEYSAAYFVSFKEKFADNRKDDRLPSATSDIEEHEISRNRSLFLEALKAPNKKISLTLMGQPKLSILDFISVNANNPLFDGQYTITEILHSISMDEGFTTVIDCIRVIPNTDVNPKNVNVG